MRCGHCQNYLTDTTLKRYCLTCGSYICSSCISGDTSHLESSTDDCNLFEQPEHLCSTGCRVGDNGISEDIKSSNKHEPQEDLNSSVADEVLERAGSRSDIYENLGVYTDRVSEKVYYIRDTITVQDGQKREHIPLEIEKQSSEQSADVEFNHDISAGRQTVLNQTLENSNMPDESTFEDLLEPSAKITHDSFNSTAEPLQMPLVNLTRSAGRNTDMNLKVLNNDLGSLGEEVVFCNEQESGYGSQSLLQSSNEMLVNGVKAPGTSNSVINEIIGNYEVGNLIEDNVNSGSMVPEEKSGLVQNRGKSASIADPVMRRNKKVSPDRFLRGLSRSNSLPDLLKSTTIERQSALFGSNDQLSKSTVDLLENDNQGAMPFQMCDKDHKAPPAYICFKDNEIYCKVCVQIHNLHCKEKVKFIPEIPPETRTKACDDSLRGLLSAKERFAHVKHELDADLELLKDNRKEYVRSVMRFKQNMINLIDTIEKQALADMDLIYSLELEKLQKNLAKLESSISNLDQLLEEVKVHDRNEDNSIFYKIQSASKFVTECELDLHGIHKSCFKTEFSFQPQETITSLNNNTANLWTIRLTKDVKCHAPYPCTCDRSYKYRKAEIDKQFSAKLSGWSFDRDKCYISGCEFLDNGNLLLADNHNKKIKMFDKKYKCISALSLSSLPWDLAVLDKNLAVVTIPDKKQLQFFETRPKLASKHSVFLEKNCWGVARTDEILVVTCWSRDTSEILLMDLEGVVKRTIASANRTPFSIPWYVSASNDVIRVSDWGSNKVTFLSLKGKFLGQYSDGTLLGAMGIFSDPDDNVYVCGRDTNNIQQVGSDGGKVQTILSERDGIEKPLCVCHCPLDNRFVVTSWMSDTVQVFRLV